jgi:hypothetical protein
MPGSQCSEANGLVVVESPPILFVTGLALLTNEQEENDEAKIRGNGMIHWAQWLALTNP